MAGKYSVCKMNLRQEKLKHREETDKVGRSLTTHKPWLMS